MDKAGGGLVETRSQRDSKFVFTQLSALKNEGLDEKKLKQYGSLCHQFPVMVLQNGLAQAVAFLAARSDADKPEGHYLKHLSQLTSASGSALSATEFQQMIHEAPLEEYLQLTRQILAASLWFKRFAESLLGVIAGNDEDTV